MTSNHSSSLGLASIFAISALALSAGCQRESGAGQRGERREPGTITTPRTGSDYRPNDYSGVSRGGTNELAISQIATARCARERACNNVGADKKWSSDAACQNDILTSTRDELNANDCPGGIDQKELSECLNSIHNESCNNPLESMSRLVACRSSDICKALPR